MFQTFVSIVLIVKLKMYPDNEKTIRHALLSVQGPPTRRDCSLLARITTNGIPKDIYIQCSVSADKRNRSKERSFCKDKLCRQVNSYPDDYRARILAKRQELIAKGNEGNCIQIKERLQNPVTFSIIFLAESERHYDERQAEIGVRITQLTENKYHRILDYLKEMRKMNGDILSLDQQTAIPMKREITTIDEYGKLAAPADSKKIRTPETTVGSTMGRNGSLHKIVG